MSEVGFLSSRHATHSLQPYAAVEATNIRNRGEGGSSLERLDSKYKSLIPSLFLFKIVNRTCESCSSSNTIENVIGELGLHAGSDPPQKKSLRFFIDLAS